MKLVIVESPTKAKTISKFVGREYKVTSSFGHIRDLPKSKLGIDTEKDFEPQYVIPTKSRKAVSELKKLATKKTKIILATDEDREGEAIAWHLTKALKLEPEQTERIVFHEITKSAIEEAIKNPREINFDLVNAQQGRRVLDRIVGYKLSPFLWKKIARGLSAGRVQSVAVKIIMEREDEINKFKPEEYWTIKALFETNKGEVFEASIYKIEGESVDKFQFKNKEEADNLLKELKKASFKISKVDRKETKKNPLAPFITSTLQQTSSTRLGFSAKKTMFLAQRLYERGLITYMRTDSTNISKEALASTKEWLIKEFGDEYATQAPRLFTKKSKMAQEAHEAIRPTDVSRQPGDNAIEEAAEQKLYDLIWSRFVSSQMPQAIFDSTQINIDGDKFTFRVSGTILKFDGFLKVWKQKSEDKNLPEASEGDDVNVKEFLSEQHFTEPPPRFNEASLIKTLEEHGIGRPSTYAPIISVIQDRHYVEKVAGRLQPTETGTLVNKVIIENFPLIVDLGFTAKMEGELDEVAAGEKKWNDVIREFYGPFAENLEKKYEEVSKDVLVKPEEINEKCDKCGKPMIVKFSRFGKFIACSGFPECRNTKKTEQEKKKIGLKCPKCNEGEIVERRVSKGRVRGKVFWGCERYPKCDYASWDDPRKPKPEKKSKKDNKEELKTTSEKSNSGKEDKKEEEK